MNATLQEIAQWVKGSVAGDPDTLIHGVAAIEDAQPGEISFVDQRRYVDQAVSGSAAAICVSPSLALQLQQHKPLVIVDQPRIAFMELVKRFRPARVMTRGIHPTAVIEDGATIGKDVCIGAGVFIGSGATIDDRVQIHAHVHVGRGVRIGADSIVYPHVVLYDDVTILRRVIIHAGVVIGSDGFGFEQMEGRHVKVPQAGTVIVEDDVEIGANSTIDRAALSATVIGEGTKIDNLVHIGHNSKVGKHCIIVAQVGLAGGVVMEDGVMVGGQAGLGQQIRVGRGARVGGQSGVISDVPADAFVSGCPSGPHYEMMRAKSALRRLPELVKTVRTLEKEMRLLRQRLESGSG